MSTMTVQSPTVAQHEPSKQITEEWMMMHPPSSTSSANTALLPPTFLEIMFLQETEQYIYNNLLPTLFTEIQTRYIRPLVHQLLVSLRNQHRPHQPADFIENETSNETTIATNHSLVLFWKRMHNVFRRMKTMVRRYLQTRVLPLMIRIVTKLDTQLSHSTNGTHHYRLIFIYVLRYIFDRYTLIKYHCTATEWLYGGGTMIRKQVMPVPVRASRHHSNSTTTTHTMKLLPLQKNDQIRTALLLNVMGYIYETLKQVHSNQQGSSPNENSNKRQRIATNSVLYPCVLSLYQIFNHIYYPYQYLIGTSYYTSLSNRLLQQILLLRPQPPIQQSYVSIPDHSKSTTEIPNNNKNVPSSSSSSMSSCTWYMTTMLRTSGILLLSGCYMTQMIIYYIQRYRTLRQERLLQRQPPKHRNHHVRITNLKHHDTNNNNDIHNHHETSQQDNDDEASSLQRLLSSSDGDILPVPLLPNDIQKSRLLQHTHLQKGICPICQQPIHRSSITSDNAKTTTTTPTMLFGYVYCSYTCIYHYLLDHDGTCPMTGRPVHRPTNTTGSRSSSSSISDPSQQQQQLIRLL